MDVIELNQERLLHFREAHGTRRDGLKLRNQKILDLAAEMYGALGCPCNADMTRRSLERMDKITFMESDRQRS